MRTGLELHNAVKPFAVDFPKRSWWVVLSTGALLVAAVTGTVIIPVPALQLVCSVLAGLLGLRSFVIYHDQQHHAILSRSRLAEWLMRGFGVLALSPSSIWRSSHNYHHKHNSNLRSAHIGSFPVMTRAQYLKSPPLKRFQYLFTRHPLTILFGYLFVFLVGMCVRPFLNDPRRHWECLLALLIHLGIGVALVWSLGWWGLLVTQTIPHFVMYAIGSYLFYAQHNFPTVTFKDKAGWTYEKAALESSSYLKTNPVLAWFTANIGYHHIHHLNARIPFYRLPEVLAAVPELQSPRTTSLTPWEIYRCLRLKLWDVSTQRMISLSQAHHHHRSARA